MYAIKHLGVGVPPRSTYASSIQSWRVQLAKSLFQPSRTQQRAVVQRLRKAQIETLIREQAKLNELAHKLLGELLEMDAEVIAAKLKDEHPLTRWAAAMVAGRKRMHLEAELIDRLSDPYPQVREAAREAMIRLSRGNDFGPLPTASAKQIAQSAQAWRQWHSLQDPPERLPEYLSYPQPEPTEPPVHVAELLPPPHAEETADALE